MGNRDKQASTTLFARGSSLTGWAAALAAVMCLAACGLFGGTDEGSSEGDQDTAAQPAADAGGGNAVATPTAAESPSPVETPTAVPATESITVGPDAGSATTTTAGEDPAAMVGGEITGDGGAVEVDPSAAGEAPADVLPPEELNAPPLPVPANASPELTQLMEERERLNAEIRRLNALVDRDVIREPNADVRLNRYSISSANDRARLNRLVQQRRDLDRRIQEMGGPAPTPPAASPPLASDPPPAGPAPDLETPIVAGSPDELTRLQERRERLSAEIQRLNRIVDLDVNRSPDSKVRLNRYAISSANDRARLNRLVQQRRAIDRRITELQGH